MNQYVDYIRKAIIDTVTTTTDEEILHTIYGLLMKEKTASTEHLQQEMLQSHS